MPEKEVRFQNFLNKCALHLKKQPTQAYACYNAALESSALDPNNYQGWHLESSNLCKGQELCWFPSLEWILGGQRVRKKKKSVPQSNVIDLQ